MIDNIKFNYLIGKYFYIFRNSHKEIQYQGKIIEYADGYFVCQMFDFFLGENSTVNIFKLEDLADRRLAIIFSCHSDFIEYYQAQTKKREAEERKFKEIQNREQ